MGQPFCAFDFKRRGDENRKKIEKVRRKKAAMKIRRRSSVSRDMESLADDFRRWNIHNLIWSFFRPLVSFSLFERNSRRMRYSFSKMTMMSIQENAPRVMDLLSWILGEKFSIYSFVKSFHSSTQFSN